VGNKFGIPSEIESALRRRDVVCVYCRGDINPYPRTKGSPKDKATIEHLHFDGPFYWADGLEACDLVICCQSRNSSRGAKTLGQWFASSCCIERNISPSSVAPPVRDYLRRHPRK
jgi:hypothetical protein